LSLGVWLGWLIVVVQSSLFPVRLATR
jgi:hypothetical protein